MLKTWALVALVTCGAAYCAPLVISRSEDLGRPFVCAGSRAFAVGGEVGDFEVWTYPVKLFDVVHVAIRPATGPPVSLDEVCTTVEVRPERLISVHELPQGKVTRTVFVPADKPAVVMVLEPDGLGDGAVAQIELTLSLRVLWPGRSDGISPLFACEGTEVGVLFNALEGGPALFGAVKANAPILRLVQRDAPDGVSARFPAAGPLVLAFVGSVGTASDAVSIAAELVRNWDFYLRKTGEGYRDATDRCELSTGLDSLDAAFAWAKAGLAACAVDLTSVGAGLVAGYGPSGTGNQPGCAWWDGRDSAWASTAASAVGQVASAAATLDCLGRNQASDGDSRGQIPSMVSPAGRYAGDRCRYEGADATSLFLVNLRWLWRWTGDEALVRRHKDAAVRALDWLKGRDAGDALSLSAVEAVLDMVSVLGLQDRAAELAGWESRARAAVDAQPQGGLLPVPWADDTDNATVQPLATAWAATAAFRAGDPERGLALLESNVRLAGAGAFGRMPQFVSADGTETRGAVLSASSEAAVVLPVICGMLGIEPDAPHDCLTVSPSLPASVPEVRLTALRIGAHEVDLDIARGKSLAVTHQGKRPLTVRLLVGGREIRSEVRESAELTWP